MNRKTSTAILMAAIIGIGLGSFAGERPTAKAKGKQQTTCPVMGGKIDKTQYVDVNGKRIYTCCAGCVAKIKADPEKYIKKLEAEGVVLEKTPKKAAGSHEHDHAPIKGYAEHDK